MTTTPRRARRGGIAALIVGAALAIAACGTGTADPEPTAIATPPATTEPSPASSPAAPTASAAPASSPSAGDGTAIRIAEFEFMPASLTVPVGSTVTWTNEENAFHTVTSGSPDARTDRFDSGEIDTGVEFAFTFDEAGTYPFFCDRHEFMQGEITVTP